MPAKFTFLIDGDACHPDTFTAILKVCGEQLIGCNRIIIFRGKLPFPITVPDASRPYHDLFEKMFFSDIPAELRNSASFVAYAIGHANAHTGSMKDHISDIMTQSIPFLASSRDKAQHYVFVSTALHKHDMPANTYRIRKSEDLMTLANSEVNKAGGGGTGVESLMSMIPNASRISSFLQSASSSLLEKPS